MSSTTPPAGIRVLVIDDLSKGMNTYDPDTRLGKGFYADAQNMLLTTKSPRTIGGLTRLNTTAAPSSEVIAWFEPYTDTNGNTTMIVATTAGTIYEYTVSTDTWVSLLTGLSSTSPIWSHVPFRGQLFFSNGSDRPLKFNGDNVLPIGALLVADMESDETWTGGTADTTNYREGVRGRSIAGAGNAYVAPTVDQLTGLNGGTNFASTDLFEIQGIRTAGSGAGTVRLRFGNTADTVYFEASTTLTSGTWTRLSLARSAFALTGSPVWSNIARFTIFVDTADTIVFDNAFWRYAISPPVGTLIEMYAQQLVVSGISTDRVAIQYSNAGTPDEVPTANIARFSGGRHIFERRDEITALKSYFDELIVGKVNSAWTFSGTGTNTSISALPLTIGIDSHRGVVETPWSLHFLFENNIFGARLTSRGLVSSNISSLLADIDGANLDATVAVRHDRTHTVRWSFRDIDVASENTIGLTYDYLLDAWISTYTPRIRYYTRAIVNGVREILCAQYDGFIRRVDVGTTFDGTAIVSYVTLPWLQTGTPEAMGEVVQWVGATVYLRGGATVNVDARFADEPWEFAAASFTTYGSIQSSTGGDKGFVYLGVTNRWCQLRLRATSLDFEVLLPILLHHKETGRRV